MVLRQRVTKTTKRKPKTLIIINCKYFKNLENSHKFRFPALPEN